MINGLTFTGAHQGIAKEIRTTAQPLAENFHEYVGAGKIFVEKAAKAVTSAPAAPAVKVAKEVEVANPAVSYAISHGTPETEIPTTAQCINLFI